jgi:hypothetical protein
MAAGVCEARETALGLVDEAPVAQLEHAHVNMSLAVTGSAYPNGRGASSPTPPTLSGCDMVAAEAVASQDSCNITEQPSCPGAGVAEASVQPGAHILAFEMLDSNKTLSIRKH